ncbi:MAG TPA: anti-sigma factor [Rhodoblastus sp.]|nr:anti-sigma factor [Rhodoblastus sp.]
MNDDLSMTALEYALGTLSADERAAFARQLAADAEARAALSDWERKLAPMAAAIEPIEPDAAVWRAIETGIAPQAGASNVVPLQRAVARWRVATIATSALAACLALYVAIKPTVEVERPMQTAAVQTAPAPAAHPVPAQARASESGAVATASASRQNENLVVTANGARDGEVKSGLNIQPSRDARETGTPPAFVAALAPVSAPAALIVRTDPAAHALIVRRVSGDVPAGSVLRLWLLAPGAPPRALGVAGDETSRLDLPADAALAGATVAASIEPAGATPAAPGAPYVYEGKLVRD